MTENLITKNAAKGSANGERPRRGVAGHGARSRPGREARGTREISSGCSEWPALQTYTMVNF